MSVYIYIYIYIYRYTFKDSSHLRMSCASSGTGMLLTKPYVGYLDRFGLVLFSFVWISSKLFTSFEH